MNKVFSAAILSTCLFWTVTAHAQFGPETVPFIPDKAISAPLRIDYQGPIIEVLINEKPARLLYDSGASRLSLFEQSFPELSSDDNPRYEAPVFGGDELSTFEEAEAVTLQWGDTEIYRPFVDIVNYEKLIPAGGDAPFFEGALPPLVVKNKKHESIVIFDAPNQQVKHLAPGEKIKFAKPIKFDFRLENGWEWRVKLPIKLEGETKPRWLDLIVDTGASSTLMLNRESLKLKDIKRGFETHARGLGGSSISTYGGRSELILKKKSVLIDTEIVDSLPIGKDADGLIGWLALKRFRTAFDFNKGRMTFDLEGGDFEDDKIRPPRINAAGFPMSDWRGMKIVEGGRWSSAGLKAGDILLSVDGIELSETAMYSVVKGARDHPYICWSRAGVTTKQCGQVVK